MSGVAEQAMNRVNQTDEVPTEIEKKILWVLYRTPGATQEQIASTLDITKNIVKHRIDEMKGKRWIKDFVQVNFAKLGYPERFRVDIWIDPRRLKLKGEGGLPDDKKAEINDQKDLARYIVRKVAKQAAFLETILIEDVRILLGGPADLTAIVRAASNDVMLDFVIHGLRMCGAVANTATSLEQWSTLEDDLASGEQTA